MNGHCDGLWRFPAMYYTYRQCSSWRMFPLKEHVYNCVYIYTYMDIYIYTTIELSLATSCLGAPLMGKSRFFIHPHVFAMAPGSGGAGDVGDGRLRPRL
jgi:hypothetical protein